MPDEEKDPKPEETTEEAPPAEEESPESSTEETPEEKSADPNLDSPESKYWQAAYTKSRQKDAEEIRLLREELGAIKARLQEKSGEPEGEPDPKVQMIDTLLRKSSYVRALEEERRAMKARLESLGAILVTETAKARNPSLAKYESHFVEFLQGSPKGQYVAQGIQQGTLSIDDAFELWRISNPTIPRGAATNPRKPAAKVPKVETGSAASARERDIRTVARETGKRTVDVAWEEAKRELGIS